MGWEKWLDFGFILNMDFIEFVVGLYMGCEIKRFIKNNFKVLY